MSNIEKWLEFQKKEKEDEVKYWLYCNVLIYELDDTEPTNNFIKKHNDLIKRFLDDYTYLRAGLTSPLTICCFFEDVIND